MMKYTLAAVAALLAVPAFAAGPFDGPFVGVQGGWQRDTQHLGIDYNDGTRDSGSARKSGFAYGAQVGYDFRLNPSVVLGAEVSATGRTGSSYFGDNVGNAFRLKQGRTFNATARLGYLVSPTGLVYARGGYSNAQFKVDDFVGDRDHTNKGGYTVGAGYEQAITQQVSARVEYNYSHFGRDRFNSLSDFTAVDNAALRYNRSAVTAGLNYHF